MRTTNIFAAMAIIAVLASVPVALAATSSTPSTIPIPPNFNITSGTLSVCRGQIDNIPIVITNLGTSKSVAESEGAPNLSGPTMQNIQLSLGAKGLVSFPNSNNNNSVAPGKSVVINVSTFVDANATSLIFSQVDINYDYLAFYSDSEVRNVTFVTETCPGPLTVNASPSTLTSNQTENMHLNLTNSGNTTLTNLLIHIGIPSHDGGVLVNQPIQVNAIGPMSSLNLNESIDIYGNASSSFPVNITTTFYNGNSLQQVFSNRFFLSTGLIQLTPSSITVSPSPVSPGGIFSMSFVLTDTGTAGASGLTATALPTPGFRVFGSNSVFIGSISSDSQSSVTLSQEVKNNTKPGVYTVPVRVNYLNNLRQNLSTIINVSVPVGTGLAANATRYTTYRTSGGSGGGGLLIILLIIVIAVLGYLLYQERKKSRKHAKSST